MTDAPEAAEVPAFSLSLAVTNRAARSIVQLFSTDASDLLLEDIDLRQEARQLLSWVFGANGAYDFWLQNGGVGSEGDQVVNLWLSTDSVNESNRALLAITKNWPLVLMGTGKAQRYGCNEFLIIEAAALPPWSSDVMAGSLPVRVTFNWTNGYGCGIPPEVQSCIQALPVTTLPRNRLDLLLADWERYLAITQRLAEAKCFTLDYTTYRLDQSGRTARFRVLLPSGFDPRKVHAASGEEIHVDKASEQVKLDKAFAEARGEDYDEEAVQSSLLGTLTKLQGEWLMVDLDEDVVQQVERDRQALPKKGTLRYKAIGELAQVRRLRFGLQSLRRGRVRNSKLGNFLFDANEARLPDTASIQLSPGELLLPDLNEGQSRAVEGALNAPDLYLIQGPPGTGKTTVIAEICYQTAIRGGRTLVASQANLAVDHAMTRLVHHPSIRALRRGKAERVEEEGKVYLEDYVIGTWLDRVAQDCRANLEGQSERLNQLQDLLGLGPEMAAFRDANASYERDIVLRSSDVERCTRARAAAERDLAAAKQWRDQFREMAGLFDRLQQAIRADVSAAKNVAVPDSVAEACALLSKQTATARGLHTLTTLEQELSHWSQGEPESCAPSPLTLEGARSCVDYLVRSRAAKARATQVSALAATLLEKTDELHELCREWHNLAAREAPLLARKAGRRKAQAEAGERVSSLAEEIGRLETERQDCKELAGDLPGLATALPNWLVENAMSESLMEVHPAFIPDTRRAVWDSAMLAQRQFLAAMQDTATKARGVQKEAEMLDHIILQIDHAVGCLLLEVTPTALSAAQKQPTTWRGTSLENLWIERPPGVLHPVREASSAIDSLLEAALRHSQSSDPRTRFPESRIASNIVGYRSLADDLLKSHHALVREVQKQAQDIQKTAKPIADAILRHVRDATESRLRQLDVELASLNGELARAEYELEVAKRGDADEVELLSLADRKATLRRRIEAGLEDEDLVSLLPAIRLSRIARDALVQPVEVWRDRWRAFRDELDQALGALTRAETAVCPGDVIGEWHKWAYNAVREAERQLPALEADLAAAEEQVQRAEAARAAVEATYQTACTQWTTACQKIPPEERPEVKDLTSEQALRWIEDRRQSWKAELEDIWGYLRSYQDFIMNWIERIQSRNARDEEDLRQIYIDNANVIGITCVQAGGRAFSERYRDFDTVIIDEVSKATPPELLLPMLKGAKIVLVGDSRQLPPMVGPEALTDLAESLNVDPRDLGHLQRSLFRDQFERSPKELKSWLTDQYRMHPQIMDAINQFYRDKLVCKIDNPDDSRAHGLDPLLPASTHIVWISTLPDSRFFETRVGTSRRNDAEVEIIGTLLSRMNEVWGQRADDPPVKKEVGVITFYAAQERALRSRLAGQSLEQLDLRLGTVDRFQGMEKPVIVVSLVCNNSAGDIGFAKELERINVAFSRAQELLVIVGCRELFCRKAKAFRATEHYARVAEVARQSGGLLSVRDFITS